MRRIVLGLAFLIGMSAAALAQGCGPSNPNCIMPTAPFGTNTNQGASTAFVQQALAGGTAALIVGTTPITGGSANGILYNNAGKLGNLATGNNGILITSGSGVPSIATTLPSGITAPNFTVTGSFTSTGTNSFTQAVNAPSYSISGDVILVHPLTPTPNPVIGPSTNIGVGFGALVAVTSGTISSNTVYATAVGYRASAALTTADHTTSLGAFALASVTDNTGQNNTALGIDSLRNLTSGVQNVAVGEHTMTNVVTGANYNTAVGLGAMFNAGGTYNVAAGYNALGGAVSPVMTGTTNAAFGSYALGSSSGAANYNTGIGGYALFGMTNGGQNVGLGYTAGFNLTTGVNNTIIGAGNAPTLVSGSNNIIIGNYGVQADVPAAGTNSFLNIGNIIYGTGLGGTPKIGIGTATPATTLDVTGTFNVSGATTLAGLTATTFNKVTITAPASSATLTIANGKTLTASNTLTFAGTDGSTLNVGTGGTLGTAAFQNTGTSGATLPFLNGTNTWSAGNLYTATGGVIARHATQSAIGLQASAGGISGFVLLRSLANNDANDFCIYDNTNGACRLAIANNGGVTIGAATGGSQGVGTLNATGLYVNGTALVAGPAAAGTLTGTTLASNVVTSSLTSVGTLTGGATGAGFTIALSTSTITGTLPAAAGGTGASNSNTITLGGNISTAGAFTTSGVFGLTLTATATTNSTLPAGTHTLAGLDVAQTWTASNIYTAVGGVIVRNTTQSAIGLQAAAGGTSGFVLLRSISSDDANNFAIYDNTNGAARFTISNGGLTGIGAVAADSLLTINNNTGATVAPDAGTILHLVGADAASSLLTMDTFGGVNRVIGRAAAGTRASPTATGINISLLNGVGQSYDGVGYNQIASFAMRTGEVQTSTAHGGYVAFFTTPLGTTTIAEAGRFNPSGGLSVGTTTDPGIGSLQLNGQAFMPNITTSSAAQTGTVCWTTGTGKFTVDTTVGCLTSIAAAKNVLSDIDPADALAKVGRLDTKWFRYKIGYGDGGQYEQPGFIADQAATVDERLVGRDPGGTLSGVRYQEMTAFLASAIKSLKADNDNLRLEIDNLKRGSLQ